MAPIKRLEANRFVAVYTEKAQGDYKGTLDGGRAVAFEAKHTDDDFIKAAAVTKKQTGWLDRQQQYGAMCFVVVSIQARKFFRVPWKFWRDMKKHYGRKYMTLEDLQPHEIRLEARGGYIGLMFLEGSGAI